jgi:hypothetical protein
LKDNHVDDNGTKTVSSNAKDSKHTGRENEEIAYHIEWKFRPDSFLWKNDIPVALNFYPFATKFYEWLLHIGDCDFAIFTEKDNLDHGTNVNPYTNHCSVFAAILATVIKDTESFANSCEPLDEFDAEIQRVRIYNELVLYTTRFFEALIKQLLFCTNLWEKRYCSKSLGQLLSIDCRVCKKSKKTHKISLLGSLAHRYKLCNVFEECLKVHLSIINKRRNTEAAHSDVTDFIINSTIISRKQIEEALDILGNELVHTLQHISELETHMCKELQTIRLSSFIDNRKG